MSLPPACDLRRGGRGLAAIGAALILAAPAERAQALSLANPATAAAIQEGAKQDTTEVRWHHHRWHRHGRHRHWHRQRW